MSKDLNNSTGLTPDELDDILYSPVPKKYTDIDEFDGRQLWLADYLTNAEKQAYLNGYTQAKAETMLENL